jgi:hypothetical protein
MRPLFAPLTATSARSPPFLAGSMVTDVVTTPVGVCSQVGFVLPAGVGGEWYVSGTVQIVGRNVSM